MRLAFLPAAVLRDRVGASLLAATLLCGGAARADSAALGDLPLPPLAESRAVANDLVQNGRLVSIATLEPAGSLEETLAFYRAAWPADENGPGHLESAVGEWSLISHVTDATSLVVQLKTGGGAPEGLISAMSLVPIAGALAPPPPMPAGGELLSSTSATDASLTANTSVVSSRARPGELAGFYRDTMRRAGWKLVSDRRTDGPVTLLFDGRDARARDRRRRQRRRQRRGHQRGARR